MSRIDAIKDEQKKAEEGYGAPRDWYLDNDLLEELGLGQYIAREGGNFLTFTPPKDENKYFGLAIFAHFNIGPTNNAYLCLKQMKGEACPVCEYIDQLTAKEMGKDIITMIGCFPPRYLYLIVDESSDEELKKGLQVYDAPKTVNDAILGLSKDRRTGETKDISDPEHPKTLVFDRIGKKLKTRYRNFELEDAEPMDEEWLKSVVPIEDLLVYHSYDEIKAALAAGLTSQKQSAPEGETGERTSTRRARRSESPKEEAPPSEPEKEPESEKESEPEKEPEPPKEEEGRSARRRRVSREESEPKEDAKEDSEASDDIVARARERLAKRGRD